MRKSVIIRSLIWIAFSFVAAAVGGIGTSVGLGEWYEALAKPPAAPPNWVFGPVWTVLYTLMGISMGVMDDLTFRVESSVPNGRVRAIFLVQIVLNMAWPLVFFAAGALWPAVGVIIALEIAILAWIRLGFRISKPAAFALFPYAAWVAFATYLNIGYAVLN